MVEDAVNLFYEDRLGYNPNMKIDVRQIEEDGLVEFYAKIYFSKYNRPLSIGNSYTSEPEDAIVEFTDFVINELEDRKLEFTKYKPIQKITQDGPILGSHVILDPR